MANTEKAVIKNADMKIEGYGPDHCPHCGVHVGHSYWTHRALVHSALNPQIPWGEGKSKKKKKR